MFTKKNQAILILISKMKKLLRKGKKFNQQEAKKIYLMKQSLKIQTQIMIVMKNIKIKILKLIKKVKKIHILNLQTKMKTKVILILYLIKFMINHQIKKIIFQSRMKIKKIIFQVMKEIIFLQIQLKERKELNLL